jgi:hypothetical protein
MAEIKLINKDTNLKNIQIEWIRWDAYYGIIPLTIYKIPGYIHSIGGKWGENDYWCTKRGLDVNYETLMEFNGSPCNWSFSLTEDNYLKCKWEEKSVERKIQVKILRNNDVFYTFGANNLDWALARVRMLLFEIDEHPIEFYEINFKKHIIGRKIEWKGIPCIIESYCMNGNLIIVPDLKLSSHEELMKVSHQKADYDGYVAEDLFAGSIFWFRRGEDE